MSKTTLGSLIVVFVLSLVAGFFLFQKVGGVGGSGAELDWNGLGELDYVTGQAPESLKKMDGQEVRIPGFMVPLEDDQKSVTTFLLVPTPQACIHVPPPPPNQMVLVEMSASQHTAVAYGPIWVYGKLSLKSKRHMYGESSFTMQGTSIEPYR